MIMHVGVIAWLKVEYPRAKSFAAKKRHKAFFLILGHAHGVVDTGKFHDSSANPASSDSKNLVGQIEQHAVRIGQALFAQLAAFQILPVSFAFAADADFARRGLRVGSGESFKVFVGLFQAVHLEAEMFQTGVESPVSGHAPRTDRQANLAVGQIVAVIAGQTLDRLEIENFLVELGDVRRAEAADGDVIDPTRLLPAEFDIAFADIGHAFLRKIVLVAVGIVTTQSGEG